MTSGTSNRAEAGAEPASPAQDTIKQAAAQAQEGVQQVADNAQQKAQEASAQAKRTLRDQLDERSSQLGAQIREQAGDLRSVSEALREQDKSGPANVADQLAGYVDRVGGYLAERNADALLRDLEDMGRRQPGAVAAGALVAGFAASRFLKASSRRRYQATARPSSGASASSFETPRPTTEPPFGTATAGLGSDAIGGSPIPPRPGVGDGATGGIGPAGEGL